MYRLTVFKNTQELVVLRVGLETNEGQDWRSVGIEENKSFQKPDSVGESSLRLLGAMRAT